MPFPAGTLAPSDFLAPSGLTAQGRLVPAVACEIAFASNPGDAAYVWTDVSDWLRSFEIRRGRNDELGTIDSGTARLRLDNSDRRFEPEYAGSPYYPNVDAIRPVRISATWAGVTYRLFTGFVERWPPERRSIEGAYVDVEAVDGFELLRQASLVGVALGGGASGAAIDGAATAAGWPAALRAIDAGKSQIVATVGTGDALAYVQEVAASELGYVFMAGGGNLTFHDRHHRLKAPANVSKFTAGSNTAGSEIPYLEAIPSFDKEEIGNDWTVSDNASNSARRQDAASIARYFRRSRTRSVLLSIVAELADQASFLLGRYKNPALRLRQLSFRGDRVTFAALLALELGDRVTAVLRPAGGGTVTKQGNVEQITIKQERGTKWAFGLRLSPADQQTYWTADVSLAGTDTRAVY